MSNLGGYKPGHLDGDESAKTMERGANSAMPNTEFASGIHETAAPPKDPAGEKTSGTGTSAFDASGSIGKQFTSEGAIGGAAQKVGGPFDKSGSVGKQFTEKGSIGGAVQKALGEQKRANEDLGAWRAE